MEFPYQLDDLYTRKEISQLTDLEILRLKSALNCLGKTTIGGLSVLDMFVRIHRFSSNPTAMDNFWWNADYLKRFENALRICDDNINLPYFDPRLHAKSDKLVGTPYFTMTSFLPDIVLTPECRWLKTWKEVNVSAENAMYLNQLLDKAEQNDNSGLINKIFLTAHTMFGRCQAGANVLTSASCASHEPMFFSLLAYVDMRVQEYGWPWFGDAEYAPSPIDLECTTDSDCGQSANVICVWSRCFTK
jgi:hypothetical protein